ncbi:MAG: flagellar biosynthetic protein FliO [Nitrospira sp.]|nr:flagellar biosynthetic protein FliO [Nitrospira sp.]
MDLWDSLLRTLSALAIVLILMAAIAMVARRLLCQRQGQTGRHTLVHVVASGYVAPRKTISLVSVAGEYLIVGATPTELVPLGRLSDSGKVQELLASTEPGASPSGMPPPVLASWLQHLPEGMRHRDQERHDER